MTDTTYYSVALVLAALPAWALVAGKALGVWWWRPLINRHNEPKAYWLVVALQLGICIMFLLTGNSWHLR